MGKDCAWDAAGCALRCVTKRQACHQKTGMSPEDGHVTKRQGDRVGEISIKEGYVKWFNNAKGWGFISNDAGPDIFVHYSQIEGDGFRTLREGDVVAYRLKEGPRGQFAEHVTISTPPPPPGHHPEDPNAHERAGGEQLHA